MTRHSGYRQNEAVFKSYLGRGVSAFMEYSVTVRPQSVARGEVMCGVLSTAVDMIERFNVEKH